MDKAQEVFAHLQETFGLSGSKYDSFLKAWLGQTPWEFTGSVEKPHLDTLNSAVQGRLEPRFGCWIVILYPECFSVQPHSIRWEYAIQSANTFLKGFPISQS